MVVVVVVGVRPNAHWPPEPESEASSGGTPAVQVVQTPETVAVQTGAVAAEGADAPVAAGSAGTAPAVSPAGAAVRRSAGSCSSRIAFGLIGFGVGVYPVADAGVPPPDWVTCPVPRANPSCSHSVVTAVQTPDEFLYSTRR